MTGISREDNQVMFDIAVSSLDFGSGFMTNEEVEVLRRVAVALGVDPMLATPDDFKENYTA